MGETAELFCGLKADSFSSNHPSATIFKLLGQQTQVHLSHAAFLSDLTGCRQKCHPAGQTAG